MERARGMGLDSNICKGLICIVGMPYCGSTVVSYIIGAHSNIYSGADLYKLSPRYDAKCSICGDKCKVWNESSKKEVYQAHEKSMTQYFHAISKITGNEYICDASKSPDYFQNKVISTEIPTTYVNMIKHPIRHLSSLLFNHYFVKKLKIRGSEQIEAYKSIHWQNILNFLDNSIDRINSHMDKVEELRNKIGNSNWIDVKYEDIVLKSSETLTEIIELSGLEFEKSQLQYQDAELHPIVGNTGPLRRLKSARGQGSSVKKNVDLRAAFYDSGKSSIIMDDKYKMLFNENELLLISNLESFTKLCKRLGYSNESI